MPAENHGNGEDEEFSNDNLGSEEECTDEKAKRDSRTVKGVVTMLWSCY